MKKLDSKLFQGFEKSKLSDYSKVFGGILYTYHSTTWNGVTTDRRWDTKEDENSPEVTTSQENDSHAGSAAN